MIRIYIWILLLLAIGFLKYEWFKQFFTEPLILVWKLFITYSKPNPNRSKRSHNKRPTVFKVL